MWVYEQRTGRLSRDGRYCSTGWAGRGGAKNDPAQEKVPDFGPLPQGPYTIGPPEDSSEHGPHVLRLSPAWPETQFGRSHFLIHGANKDPSKYADSSHGCIILPRDVREQISGSGDKYLMVIP